MLHEHIHSPSLGASLHFTLFLWLEEYQKAQLAMQVRLKEATQTADFLHQQELLLILTPKRKPEMHHV